MGALATLTQTLSRTHAHLDVVTSRKGPQFSHLYSQDLKEAQNEGNAGPCLEKQPVVISSWAILLEQQDHPYPHTSMCSG